MAFVTGRVQYRRVAEALVKGLEIPPRPPSSLYLSQSVGVSESARGGNPFTAAVVEQTPAAGAGVTGVLVVATEPPSGGGAPPSFAKEPGPPPKMPPTTAHKDTTTSLRTAGSSSQELVGGNGVQGVVVGPTSTGESAADFVDVLVPAGSASKKKCWFRIVKEERMMQADKWFGCLFAPCKCVFPSFASLAVHMLANEKIGHSMQTCGGWTQKDLDPATQMCPAKQKLLDEYADDPKKTIPFGRRCPYFNAQTWKRRMQGMKHTGGLNCLARKRANSIIEGGRMPLPTAAEVKKFLEDVLDEFWKGEGQEKSDIFREELLRQKMDDLLWSAVCRRFSNTLSSPENNSPVSDADVEAALCEIQVSCRCHVSQRPRVVVSAEHRKFVFYQECAD